MKKILTAMAAFAIMTLSASAQEGLAIGAGYRGFLNPIFINENIQPCPQNGFFIGVDYTCEELLGPFDLTVGIDMARLWYLYNRQWDGMNLNIATLDLQVPLKIRWAFPIGDSFKCFLHAGATFDLGLTLRDGPRPEGDYRARVDLFKANEYPYWSGHPYEKTPQYNQCDCFLGGGIGFIFNDILRLTVNADWGAVNRLIGYGGFEKDITSKGITTNNSHNVQLNVGLAYCFE